MRALAPRPISRSSLAAVPRRQEGAYRDTAKLARALVLPDPAEALDDESAGADAASERAAASQGLVEPRRAPRLATLQARLQELRGAHP